MIVGDPRVFAIESEITCAYARLSLRALGFFQIHVSGYSYGVRKRDATLLACSFDGVLRRIRQRGRHTAPFSDAPDAGRIAEAFRNGLYGGKPNEYQLGIPLGEFCRIFYRNQLIWAPDGDEAFDDSSYVLHFDVADQVRLVGFKAKDYSYDSATLTDRWLPADKYYQILQVWIDKFEDEWRQSICKPNESREE